MIRNNIRIRMLILIQTSGISSMSQDDPSSFRPPQQARSQATLDRLLKAAEGLLAEIPFEQATVAEIARRSNSSVGAFYNRFPDKEALLDCFDDRFFQRAREHWDSFFQSSEWRKGRLEERIERLVNLVVNKYRENRPVLRSLALYTRARPDPRYAERRAQLEAYVMREIRTELLAPPCRITHPKPSRAVEFGFHMILITAQEVVLFDDHAGDTQPSDEELVAELTRAFLAYLGILDPSKRKGK